MYKPIYLEAQAAAAVALYLRAGRTPPTALVNGTTKDTQANADVPSVLLTPTWVTTDNMAATVVKDGAVTVAALCVTAVATQCRRRDQVAAAGARWTSSVHRVHRRRRCTAIGEPGRNRS